MIGLPQLLAVPAGLLLWAAAGAAPAARPPLELASPLPAELPITASFGEFRGERLHAGLDFSTRGELGWPVRAAADGEIVRVKIEPRGYGRAVYVRHAAGFLTVYGHLHDFEDEGIGLQRFAQAEQRRQGSRYPGDLYPDPPIPVRRGQVIGRTGESGGGPPHLHFELRDGDDPVDPVSVGGLRPNGLSAPQFEALWIVPRGPCRVDGRWGPARIGLTRRDGRAVAAGLPVVEGRFDLAATAHVAGAGTMGVGRLSLECDGRKTFTAELRRFSFAQSRQSGLLFDLGRTTSSPARYTYRLRAAPALDLPGVEGAWLRDLEEGTHRCILTAAGAAGDAAAAEFALQVGPAPPYATQLPASMASYELFERLLLIDGVLPLDPAALPAGAPSVPGFPRVLPAGSGDGVLHGPGGVEILVPAASRAGAGPLALAPASVLPVDGLEMVTAAFRLDPPDLFLHDEAILRAPVGDPSAASFYRRNPDGEGWSHMGGTLRDGSVLEVGTRTAGTFAVLRDRVAPRLTGVHLRDEPRLQARRLVFAVEEAGVGIDVEGCRVLLGEGGIEADYDPDRGWVEAWLPPGISGERAVRAECSDRAGNASTPFRATIRL